MSFLKEIMQLRWLLIHFPVQFILKEFPFFIFQEIFRKVSNYALRIVYLAE
jgi:hypothetical protein